MKKIISLKNLSILLFWIILGTSSSILVVMNDNLYNSATMFLGILLILHSFIYFIKHGGRYITPSGMYLLYSALIHGFSSVYAVYTNSYNILLGHYVGLLIVYFSQVIVYSLFSVHTANENNYHANFFRIDIRHNYFGVVMVSLVITFIISAIMPYGGLLQETVFYFIIIFMSINIIFNKKKIGIRKIIVISIMLIFYYTFLFEGFGRINIATLLAAILMILQFRIRNRNIKLIGVLSFIPLIMIASLMRGGTIDNIGSGLVSIILPFQRLGQIIQLYLDGILGLSYGQTIYSALVVLVPRTLWQNKPWNFNRQITYIFAPQYISAGHSEASVLLAELIYNYGLMLGFIVSVLFAGVLLPFLDKKISFNFKKSKWDLVTIIIFTILIVASSGLLNLLWGGFSTFINRDGFRMLFGLSLLIIVKLLIKIKIKH